MRQYLLLTMGSAALFLLCHFAIILFAPAPISAGYWVREMIEIKEHLVDRQKSEIIFLGGSSTLFGVDAKLVSKELGVPAFNFGLHAGLRLDRILMVARHIVRRGDILVMPLESGYYSCEQKNWNDWQLRNAIAWDRPYFVGFSFPERAWAAYSGATPTLAAEIFLQYFVDLLTPDAGAERQRMLAPPDVIWAQYASNRFRTREFAYSAFNIDAWGDMQGNVEAQYAGVGIPADEPASICSPMLELLTRFVAEMNSKGVRVIFANMPYLVSAKPAKGWQAAARSFGLDIAKTGASLLDQRDRLFFSRKAFFNTSSHLNAAGRDARTRQLIQSLRMLGLARSAQPSRSASVYR